MSERRSYRPVIGLAAGVAVGLMDLAVLYVLGVQMVWRGIDLILPVMGVFTATFGALGAMNGRLADDRVLIREQLAELERRQERVLHYEKLASIGRMAAGVAHEVRNPLGVIKSAAALLCDNQPGDEDAQKAGRFIAEEVDRLDGFVRSLLDFSRPIRAERRDVALAAVAERVGRLCRAEAEGRGVALEITTSGGSALVDEDLVVRAAAALCTNACQAARERVEAHFEARGDAIEVRVADDGVGVDGELSARIFEPFVTSKAKGTGLGLPMAQRIAEAHGGRIELQPPGHGLGEGGRGACFVMRVETAAAEVAA